MYFSGMPKETCLAIPILFYCRTNSSERLTSNLDSDDLNTGAESEKGYGVGNTSPMLKEVMASCPISREILEDFTAVTFSVLILPKQRIMNFSKKDRSELCVCHIYFMH